MKFMLVTLFVFVALCGADEQKGNEKKEEKNFGTVIGIDLGTTYSWWALFYVLRFSIVLSFQIYYFIQGDERSSCNLLSVLKKLT